MDNKNTESIVKEFLELWQKQFAHMSREGDNVVHGLDAFKQMQDAYIDAINAGLGTKSNAQSVTTSDIFRNIGNEFGRLAKSYAQLEERIAALESGVATGRRRAETEAPKRTNKHSGKRTPKTGA